MDDTFASIISESIIPSEVEETLPYAPLIAKPCFFSGICSLDGQDLSTAPNPLTSSDIRRLPDSPSKPRDKDSLRDIPAHNRSSSMPPPHLRLDDFTTLIKYFSQNADKSLGRHDILEIAEKKGSLLSSTRVVWLQEGAVDVGCSEAFPFEAVMVMFSALLYLFYDAFQLFDELTITRMMLCLGHLD